MNKEVKELIERARGELKDFDIELSNSDEFELKRISKSNNPNNALLEIDMIIDGYFYDKFLQDSEYNYMVEKYNEYTNDNTIAYYIGNGLIGYEIRENKKRYVNEYDLEIALDDLEEKKFQNKFYKEDGVVYVDL